MSSNGTWTIYKRVATPSHTLEAKRAEGGESIGFEGLGITARKGQWLCRNPENGHQWTIDDEAFPQFYIADRIINQQKTASQKQKPTRKSPAKDRRPASHQGEDPDQLTDLGPLFDG